jgi:hypothetical protein
VVVFDEDRHQIMQTVRLQKYDLEQAEKELDDLKRKVQRRRTEVGILEIIVDEKTGVYKFGAGKICPGGGRMGKSHSTL